MTPKIIRIWHGGNSICVELPPEREEVEFRAELEARWKERADSVTADEKKAFYEDYCRRHGSVPNPDTAEQTITLRDRKR